MKKEHELKVKEALVDYDKHYTYADYLTWDDDLRYELIDGVPFLMSAPTVNHQKLSGRLYLQLGNYLKDKSCDVYYAPFDVRLNADTTDDTVVQPDILVIFDESIMMKTGCIGPPDLVIEVQSPSTSVRDMTLKFEAYQKSGVREYWIIDPEKKLTITHILDNGRYYTRPYTETDKAPVHILEDFEIDLADVFGE